MLSLILAFFFLLVLCEAVGVVLAALLGDRDRSPHHHQDGGYALPQRWL